LLFGLQNDLVEIDRQINDLQSELKTLLAANENQFIAPQITFNNTDTTLNAATLGRTGKKQTVAIIWLTVFVRSRITTALPCKKQWPCPILPLGAPMTRTAATPAILWV
jgi:hypothetical protein